MRADATHRTIAENVVQLLTRGTTPLPNDCFVELDAYWTALSAGRLMPARSEVDPRGISGALHHTFLVERIAPGLARFRLAGQHLSDIMGMDVRGMPLSTFFTPKARDPLAELVKAVFDDPARIDLTLDGGRSGLRARIAGRLMMLPLRDAGGAVSRAIGCIAVSNPVAGGPCHFDITDQTCQTLIGYGSVEDAPKAPPLDFGVADAAREKLRHKEKMRSTLRLVTTD